MKPKKTVVDKAIETLVSHSEKVLLGLDYAPDYVFIEVPIENRLDIARHYNRGCDSPLVDTRCNHCHKVFKAAFERNNNPKDVCHCIYKRYMDPYHGGFMYLNETAIQYDKQFGHAHIDKCNSVPLNRSLYEKTNDNHDNSWILRHGNVVTVSRSFGQGVGIENNLTLGIAHIEEEYNRNRAQSKVYRDHDRELTKANSDSTNVIFDANFEGETDD